MHYGRCASGVFRNQLASKHLKDTYAKFYANFFFGGGVGGQIRCIMGDVYVAYGVINVRQNT